MMLKVIGYAGVKGMNIMLKQQWKILLLLYLVKGSPAGDIAEAAGEPVYNPGFPEQDNPEKPGFNPQVFTISYRNHNCIQIQSFALKYSVYRP